MLSPVKSTFSSPVKSTLCPKVLEPVLDAQDRVEQQEQNKSDIVAQEFNSDEDCELVPTSSAFEITAEEAAEIDNPMMENKDETAEDMQETSENPIDKTLAEHKTTTRFILQNLNVNPQQELTISCVLKDEKQGYAIPEARAIEDETDTEKLSKSQKKVTNTNAVR